MYILPHWRQDKHKHTYVTNYYDNTQTSEKVQYIRLCSHISKANEIGVDLLRNKIFDKMSGRIKEQLMVNANC